MEAVIGRNPEDIPPGAAYDFLSKLIQPAGGLKMANERVTPPVWQICGWHIDLSTLERGEPVDVPQSWEPLAVAEKQGNDFVIILKRQTTAPVE